MLLEVGEAQSYRSKLTTPDRGSVEVQIGQLTHSAKEEKNVDGGREAIGHSLSPAPGLR
jgi:hypothetical protein